MNDAYKHSSEGGNNHLFTGVMTFVMGIVTMVRMTRNMPRKLTDASFYSNSAYGVDAMIKGQSDYDQTAQPAVSSYDYFTMVKRMAELEDKMNVLSNKAPVMPPEKEEMLNNALSRVNALEEELSSAKKVNLPAVSSFEIPRYFPNVLKTCGGFFFLDLQALEEALVRQEELLAYIEKKKKKKKFFGF